MRSILNTLKLSSRSAVTVFSAMLFVITLGLAGSAASGQTVPPAVWSQVKLISNFPDGSIASADPSGTTMGVNQQGLVFFGNTYGNNLYELNPATGVLTTLGSPGNIAAVAVDSNNSVYFTSEYGTQITKLPYVSGAYTYPASLSGLPTCTGTDTSACVLGGTTFSADGYYFGVSSLTFDPSGDVFVALTNGNTAPNAIIYCSAACTTGSSGNGSIIFQEPTATPQLTLGSMATDAKGNLYFTDSAQDSSGNITVSHVYELPLTGSGTFAATPTLLYTLPFVSATDQIDAVNVAGNTLYFATTGDGIFAMPIVSGVANPSGLYAAAAQGAKAMATDGKGNFFVDTNANGSDNITQVSIGTITAPPTAVGSSATVSGVTTVLNDGDCTSTAITFTPTPGEFTADTTGSTCTGFLHQYGAFATNVTFAPTAAGVQTETLTATDTSGGIGTVTATGTGVGNSQTIAFTALTSPVPFSVAPITLSATASSGLAVTFSVTSGPGTISGDTLTLTGVGTVVVAANQPGNASYSAASTVSQSVVVNQATQTIAFTAPTSPVTYGVAPITLSATASSGLAVTLTVTSGPGTINGSTLTVTNDGTIVLAAAQAGNANYLAAPAVSQTIVVNPLGTVATPVFSPITGTFLTPPSVTLTSATAGASIYYTTDGSTPTASSTLYTSAITPTQTTTINAIAVETGYLGSAEATATYTIPPTFTLAVNPSALSVSYGASTAVSVTATSEYNFTGAVTFACSGLPTGATCTFVPPTAPATTTVLPGSAVVEQLNITAAHATAKLEQRGINPFIPGGATLAAVMCFVGLRKRRRLQVALFTMLCMAALVTLNGCSGTLPLPQAPTATTITIAATSGSITISQTLSLTEQ